MKKILFLSMILLGFYSTKTFAQTSITAGQPKKSGIDTYTITGNNNKVIAVPVVVPGPPAKATDKARAIKEALDGLGIPSTRNGATVHIPSAKSAVLDKGSNKSMQGGGVSRPGKAIKNTKLQLDFHEGISGVDFDGFESIFQSSFGSSGFFADSELTFGMLSGITISDLLTDTFNELLLDLPQSLQPNLSLDLDNELITFLITDDVDDAFVMNNSTDTMTEITFGLISPSVPEPSSILSLLALGTLGAASTLKRKLKPSKSTEKELEKVS